MIYEKISGFSDEIASDIDTQFSVLCKLGIKYFEPRGINGKNISKIDDNELLMLKAKMAEYGIKASSIGSPIGKIKLTDDFEAHFELFKRVVTIANALDTKYIRMFSFYHNGGEWTVEERSDVIAKLRRMIDYAKQYGVILLHENEKDIYGDTVERCFDLMETLGCENFRSVFDPANFVQCGQNTKTAFDKLQKHVAYVHIKDAKASDGTVVPAGMGDGNFDYLLLRLFASGYDGFLSLEPHLGSFDGLADLELDDKMLGLPKSGEGTFTLAHSCLLDVIARV
ncbi:MAG: sugar phosphate isomerase/epimerase [Clostridia bacterium]|nr:sugar phosphate isomerase/epimerase [Clostridia bacterium]